MSALPVLAGDKQLNMQQLRVCPVTATQGTWNVRNDVVRNLVCGARCNTSEYEDAQFCEGRSSEPDFNCRRSGLIVRTDQH